MSNDTTFDMGRFRQPLAADRIHPFWFWNGEMDDEQIVRQIDEMAEKGLGGFFICARQGLQLPYLSDVWFEKVRTATRAAQERGLHVWLYDEYPYPSGIAGGEVTLELPEAKHYSLVHTGARAADGESLSLELPWARIIYAKAFPVDADGRRRYDKAISIRSAIGNWQADPVYQKAGLTAYNQKRFFTYRTVQRLDWTAPAGQWEVLVVQEKEIEDFKYYGTFVDPCNKEAMAAFIRLTHDKYAAYVGEYFGGTIKGMFTDEIGLLGSIPWSPQLAQAFRDRCGYELTERLYALLDPEADDAPRIRYDYYQTVHELLRDSYHKQVHDWCERHGLQYVAEVPSVRHTTQLYSHVPGGDTAHEKLGRSLDWILNLKPGDIRASAKMVSSLARQLGRERNLIECFHSVGWSMTLQDARWMIDRLAAMGTNFFNFHAFFYTVDGLAQHDAPPSQFLQNPYWKHFRQLGDYTGRLSYVMSSGEALIPVAVLSPTTSLWTKLGNPFHGFSYGGVQAQESARLDDLKRWWTLVTNGLTKRGIDYDHLDPELLAAAEIEGGEIRLGRARYRVLVLPPLTNLEQAAWLKLEAFIRGGGRVIGLGQLPYEAIEAEGAGQEEAVAQAFGLGAAAPRRFWEAQPDWTPAWSTGGGHAYFMPFPASAEAAHVLEPLERLLEELSPRGVQVLPACGEWGLLLQTRRVGADRALIFVSNQEGTPRETTLRLTRWLWPQAAETDADAALAFRELSLETGEALALAGQAADGAWHVPLALAPYEARLVEVTRTAPGGAPIAAAGEAAAEEERGEARGAASAAPGSAPGAASSAPVSAGAAASARSAVAPGLAERQDAEQPAPDRGASLAPVVWTWAPDAAGPWTQRALGDNAVRFETFALTVQGEQGVAISGAIVQAKTFIDQCGDVAAAAPLPLRMAQTFGAPLRLGLAYPLQAVYRTEFIVRALPPRARFVMDRSAIYGAALIRMNGHAIRPETLQPTFVYDHNNVACEVGALLREGVNELAVELEVAQDWHGVVDALYITGPFTVAFDERQRPVLGAAGEASASLAAGPYPGYPYYAGEFSFARRLALNGKPDGARFELAFAGWDAGFHDVAEVLVNGHSLGARPWSPYRWQGDAALLREGDNEIEVRVTNTLIGLLEGKYFDEAAHEVKPVIERKD